jgi:thymidylate synthase (FAD)
MIIVRPKAKIVALSAPNGVKMLQRIEHMARICYKSEDRQTSTSYEKLLRSCLSSGHMSIFEHGLISVEWVVDRGVQQELTRHRLPAYSIESTRYCTYTREQFGNQIKAIPAPEYWLDPNYRKSRDFKLWKSGVEHDQQIYQERIATGVKAQIARDNLPLCLASTVGESANPRAWRHIMIQRTAWNVHPKLLEVALPLLAQLKKRVPILFDDIVPLHDPKENNKYAQ